MVELGIRRTNGQRSLRRLCLVSKVHPHMLRLQRSCIWGRTLHKPSTFMSLLMISMPIIQLHTWDTLPVGGTRRLPRTRTYKFKQEVVTSAPADGVQSVLQLLSAGRWIMLWLMTRPLFLRQNRQCPRRLSPQRAQPRARLFAPLTILLRLSQH